VNLLRAAVGIGGALTLALLTCGCGQASKPPGAPVRLSLQAPPDDVRVVATSATVKGDVMPARARVLILGHSVPTDVHGHFSTRVALSPGTNLIDVIASAPRARPAMVALRVIRYLLVTVPDITGRSPASAIAVLRAHGLKPILRGDGNPLSFLLPFSMQVCSQSPSGGARVQPNSTVTLQPGQVCV
jgi:hypothetical protein